MVYKLEVFNQFFRGFSVTSETNAGTDDVSCYL